MAAPRVRASSTAENYAVRYRIAAKAVRPGDVLEGKHRRVRARGKHSGLRIEINQSNHRIALVRTRHRESPTPGVSAKPVRMNFGRKCQSGDFNRVRRVGDVERD